jgi:PKHD-type hydroxylase
MNENVYFAPVQRSVVPTAVQIEHAFDAAALDRIDALCRDLPLQQSRVGQGGVVNTKIRDSRVTWLANDSTWGWFYQAMQGFVQTLNFTYAFDLWGFKESFQYSEYLEGGHFDWHVDAVVPLAAQRKLSVTLQLSDPLSYDGGDLQIWGADAVVCPRGRGTLICFPSYTLHRVTPVTRGMRRSLVVCAVGPQFR